MAFYRLLIIAMNSFGHNILETPRELWRNATKRVGGGAKAQDRSALYSICSGAFPKQKDVVMSPYR